MQMRMKQQVLPPTVKHGEETDLGSQMLGVGRDGSSGFGRGPEENAVDHLLVLVGDRGNLFRHGEDDMEVRDSREVRLGGPRSTARGPAIGTLGSGDRGSY